MPCPAVIVNWLEGLILVGRAYAVASIGKHFPRQERPNHRAPHASQQPFPHDAGWPGCGPRQPRTGARLFTPLCQDATCRYCKVPSYDARRRTYESYSQNKHPPLRGVTQGRDGSQSARVVLAEHGLLSAKSIVPHPFANSLLTPLGGRQSISNSRGAIRGGSTRFRSLLISHGASPSLERPPH